MFAPFHVIPSSMVAPKNVASNVTHLCRMLGINNEHNLESADSLAEYNCENELKTMLIKAIENGSASQTRFLGSIYAMRIAGKGKQISLQNFLDQSTNSTGDEKSKQMHAILSQIFQEYNS
uniref:Uncharacterized protein n=1 Tax=Ditylenchus dipsaci TaxID=166011 RepID=A0A915DYW3_9BILA